MTKIETYYICQSCAYKTPKWLGKCPDCQEWNTFVEEVVEKRKGKHSKKMESLPKKISEIQLVDHDRIKIGISEFDRVLGGGLVHGSLILIGGEPGIGKSTLLTGALGSLVENKNLNGSVLYVSGEESESQVANRAKRLNIESNEFYVINETSWQKIYEYIKTIKPKILVIDSIQTTISEEIGSAPGTVAQIREVTYTLMNFAKSEGLTCFIIGHITKEGAIAGPKILEHMVDTVIYFEGDQFGHYRILRCIKNRFGNTNEVGIFEMKGAGLQEVKSPSKYFLESNFSNSFGRSLTCIIEGSRVLFVEIQALVVENKFGAGRRTTQGIDSNRLAMLIAVIEKYLLIPIGSNDVYLNVVGGIKLDSRDSDLAILASLLSSFHSKSINDGIIFLGEVGLTGEVRNIPRLEQRLQEISQMNYKKIIVSKRNQEEVNNKFNFEVIGISKAEEIMEYL